MTGKYYEDYQVCSTVLDPIPNIGKKIVNGLASLLSIISGQRYQRSDLCRSCLSSYLLDLYLRQIQHQADQEEARPGEGSQGDRQLGCGR